VTDDWSVEAGQPLGDGYPFRKFVAGSDWLEVGDLISKRSEETYAHLDLHSRAPAALSDGSIVFGWLYGDSERVRMETTEGSLTELARSELDAWARREGIEIRDS
jgi:hypothetical protein